MTSNMFAEQGLDKDAFNCFSLVIDCETTGVDSSKHQMLTIAGIMLDKRLREVGSREWGIKHEEYVCEVGALAANKIDLVKHDHEAKMVPEMFARDFVNWSQGFTGKYRPLVVGWNVDFDVKFLREILDPLMRWPFHYRTYDVRAMRMAIRGSVKKSVIGRPDAHTAMEDTRVTVDIYREDMALVHKALALEVDDLE